MEVDAVSHATVFGLDPLWLSTAILILSYASIMT